MHAICKAIQLVKHLSYNKFIICSDQQAAIIENTKCALKGEINKLYYNRRYYKRGNNKH